MKRKAAWCGLSFLLGDLLYCAFGESYFILAAGCAALCLLALLTFTEYRAYAAAVGVSVLCGLTVGRAYALLHIVPAERLDGQYITVEGEAADSKSLGSDRFLVTVDGEAEGRSVRVNFYTDRCPEPYEKVRISGKVSQMTDSARFNSRSYYYPRGIFLEGNADSTELTGEFGSPIMRGVTALRDYASKSIAAAMDPESAAFAQAILCGDKSELPLRTKTILYRSGIGHLFALSGTHLTIIAAVFSAALGLLIRSKRIKLVTLEGVILLFVAFGGLSPSLVRAGIMTSLVFCSSLAGRRTDVLSSLGICAVLMCGANPLICLSPSFVCSFGSCFALGAVAPKLTENLKGRRFAFVIRPVIETAVIIAVMMPILALWFSEVSLIAVLTQPVLVPLCTAALTLCPAALLLGGTTLPAELLLRFADLLIKAMLRLSEFFASLSFAAIGCRHIIPLLAGSAILAAALTAAVRSKKLRIFVLSAAGTFILLWAYQSVANAAERSEVRVKLFSNGRSICAAAVRGGDCVVLDIGAKGSYCYGLQQYLSRSGVRHCRTAFIAQELGASAYKTELYPEFETLRTDTGYFSEPFPVGAAADINGLTVARTADGYDLIFAGRTLSLTKNTAALSGEGELSREALKNYPELIIR